MYRRLLPFLRPHAWRMAGAVACNAAAAAMDVFAFTLLIPFLNVMFQQPPLGGDNALLIDIPRAAGARPHRNRAPACRSSTWR